jgi:3-deoxy-D-manno-octulosonic acid kinase
VVAREASAAWIRGVLERTSLYEWAGQHPEARSLRGRVPAFSVPVPNDSTRVVVRHAHHGGLLGPLRGDRFLPPTRAPYELVASYVLASAGVRTPPVVGFAVYQAGWLWRRNDFVTLALDGQDLGSALVARPDETARRSWLSPLADLLRALTRAGAWHPDLNVGNILLVPASEAGPSAFVLDVDRVRFLPPGDPNVRDANLGRLERSMRKWRALHGTGFDDGELRELREIVTAASPAGA